MSQFGLNYGLLNQHNLNKKEIKTKVKIIQKKGINSLYTIYRNANKFLSQKI